MSLEKKKTFSRVKKFSVALLLIGVLIGVVAPIISSATTTHCCRIHRSFEFEGVPRIAGTCVGEVSVACVSPADPLVRLCDSTTPVEAWGLVCMLNTVYRITDLIFAILLMIAVIMGLMAAYNILTAAGDAEKINKGRDLLLYAIIGVVVAFFARAIPSIVALVL